MLTSVWKAISLIYITYKIYSISGGCINIGSVNENRQLIPIGQLQKGTYFLTLHATGGHMVYNQKFIK